MNKLITLGAVTVLTVGLLAGCAETDVVAKYSPGSFETIVKADPELIKDNTLVDHYYDLSADGRNVLRISHDYAMTGEEDLVIQTPLQPFLDAGLDQTKLGVGYRIDADKLLLLGSYGEGNGQTDNVTDSLFESVKSDRSQLTYHQDLDHYGIKLTNGKFEFAKDYTKNDKDLVFVLAATPLAEAGVDVEHVEGWVFKTMEEPDGSEVEVLLAPYDLQ